MISPQALDICSTADTVRGKSMSKNMKVFLLPPPIFLGISEIYSDMSAVPSASFR